MFKKIFSLMALIILLISCQEPVEKKNDSSTAKANLSNYWKSSYGDGFEISGTNYTQYDDASKSISFAGTIVNNPDLSSSSNYLIILITNAGSWGKTVGNYYVIHYKDLTITSVKQSSAYKSGGPNDLPTKTDAETEFTIANGYFTFYGDYVKQ